MYLFAGLAWLLKPRWNSILRVSSFRFVTYIQVDSKVGCNVWRKDNVHRGDSSIREGEWRGPLCAPYSPLWKSFLGGKPLKTHRRTKLLLASDLKNLNSVLLKNKDVLMGGFQIINGGNWLVQAYVSTHRMFFWEKKNPYKWIRKYKEINSFLCFCWHISWNRCRVWLEMRC